MFLKPSLFIFLLIFFSISISPGLYAKVRGKRDLKKLKKEYLIKLQNYLLLEQIQKNPLDYEYLAELVYLLGKYNFPVQSYKIFNLLKDEKPALISAYQLKPLMRKVSRKVAAQGIIKAIKLRKEGRNLDCIEQYFKSLIIDRSILEKVSDEGLLDYCRDYLDGIRQKNPRSLSAKMTLWLGYFNEVSGRKADAINMYKWALTKRGIPVKEKKKLRNKVEFLLASLKRARSSVPEKVRR
ncbi:hypothetical protein ACFL35_19275, partial [Candidatus Riflebacteria bacterium]